MFDVFFHFRSLLLEGDRVGIQGCSILDIGCVYCILETLYIRLELGDVLLKVVVWLLRTGAEYGSCLILVCLRLTSLQISCRRSIS